MRTARSLLLVAVAAAIGVPESASAQRKVRVAILDIRALGSTEGSKAELLNEVALTEASSMPGFEVIGKSDINAIIGFEKQKKVMGCSEDSSCLAEIGGALGVDFIMVGSVGAIEDLYRLDLKLVETKKAKVKSRIGVSVEGKERKLVAAIQKAVHDLLEPETPKAPPEKPVAKAATAGAVAAGAAAATPGQPASTAAKAPTTSTASAPKQATATSAPTGVSTQAGGWDRRTWAYVSGGTGAALILGGVIFGVGAKNAYDKEKKAAEAGDQATYEDQKKKVKSLSTTANVFYVLGAAGVGVGAYLWYTSRPPSVAFEVTPLPGGAFASISGGF